MTPILGIVTIGQTPRPDLAEAFGAEAPNAEVRVAGALDGIPAEDLAALHDLKTPLDYPLLVRLAADGAAAVVVACAGGFPDVPCPVPVLLPGRIVPAVAGAMV